MNGATVKEGRDMWSNPFCIDSSLSRNLYFGVVIRDPSECAIDRGNSIIGHEMTCLRSKLVFCEITTNWNRKQEMFYLTTHSTHLIYGYMASDMWLRTILIVRKETRCRHIGYSFRLTARVLLYASSHRQDSTYHGLC